MRNSPYIILFCLFSIVICGISCNKLFPFMFADDNEVQEATIRRLYTTGIEINSKGSIKSSDATDSDAGVITFSIANGGQFFPLMFTIDLVTSPKSVLRNWPDEPVLTFDNASEFKEFYVIAESGKAKKWIIRLVDNTPPPPDPNKQNTSILAFTFLPIEQGNIKIIPSDVSIIEDAILLSYDTDENTQLIYPITITPEIKLANGATIKEGFTPGDSFVFTASDDVKTFTVLAADGVTEKVWKIKLKAQILGSGSPAAEITVFRWLNILPTAVTKQSSKDGLIHLSGRTIYIPIYSTYDFAKPIKVTMESLKISEAATMTSDDYTGVFNFTDFNDIKILRIKAENGAERVWQIKLVFSPQLENSNFENWNTSTPPSLQGGHWVVNNNSPSMVAPVVMVEPSGDAFSGSKSAEISTRCVTRGAVGVNSTTPVSAGAIFAGKFEFNASEANIKIPSGMYKYGVPFTYAPTYMHVALKYLPASPTYDAGTPTFSYVAGNAVPTFSPVVIPDPDECHIWIKVYDGNENGIGNVIGEGEFSSGFTFSEWTEIYIPIKYSSTNPPAYIAVNFTSSKRGLSYIGASGGTSGNTKGSTLLIDDVEFQYLPIDFPYPSLPD